MDIRIKVGNPSESVRGLVKDFMGNLLTERVSIVVNDGMESEETGSVENRVRSGNNKLGVVSSNVCDIRNGLNLVETLKNGLASAGMSNKMPNDPNKVIDGVLDDILSDLSDEEHESICLLASDDNFLVASIVLQRVQDAIAKKVSGR